ncbi:MAG: O-antigen ligase family protein [Lentisphaerae bacterium]|nr:O-antigen ligase family protein [Lentisphaerota bacterium]
MHFAIQFLGWIGFTFLSIPILFGPWFFGAWEMWWFWPFTVCIYISTFFFAAKYTVLFFLQTNGAEEYSFETKDAARTRAILITCFAAFLIYAFARFIQAPVRMDAERSFLLFWTPSLILFQVLFGFTERQYRFLFKLVFVNLILLGVYGVINHFITHNELVLWTKGEPQYQLETARATGSYFCPDHFAGIMEIAFSLAVAVILAATSTTRQRITAIVGAFIAIMGVVLSKSRGGGLTIFVIVVAALIWGLGQWAPTFRRKIRLISAVAIVTVLVFLSFVGGSYKHRFVSYFGWHQTEGKTLGEITNTTISNIRLSSRGRMISAAIRAWRTNLLFGIGPGMHQNLWPHFAASPDGNKELGKRPSVLNIHFHSYEVHSDWVQLLEECGIAGLFLFLLPFCIVIRHIMRSLATENRKLLDPESFTSLNRHYAIVLGGFLACVAMSFHSLGDFNLQIPATTWMIGAIVGVSLTAIIGPYDTHA